MLICSEEVAILNCSGGTRNVLSTGGGKLVFFSARAFAAGAWSCDYVYTSLSRSVLKVVILACPQVC